MRTKKMQSVLLAVTTIFACAIANAQTEVTVIGQNNAAVDVAAVQTAVDSFDVVTLSGTFNFGEGEFLTTPAGTVFITRPNMVLKGPATLLSHKLE